MFEVMDGETIRAKGTRVAAVPNGLSDEMRGEGRDVWGKRAGGEEVMFDTPCEAVRGARDDGGELFIESSGYFAVIGEVGVVKGNGLVRD